MDLVVFGHPLRARAGLKPAPTSPPPSLCEGGISTRPRLGGGFRWDSVGCAGMTVGVLGLYCEAQNM